MTQEEKEAFANGHLTGKILVEYAAHAKVRDGKRHCEMDWKEFQRLAHYFYELGKTEQKPVELSEEDEKDMAHIIRILDDCYAYGRHDLSKTDHDNLTSTIKSLRPSWKPSEEQMEVLDKAIPVCMGVAGCKEVAPLESLYNDLKKLI